MFGLSIQRSVQLCAEYAVWLCLAYVVYIPSSERSNSRSLLSLQPPPSPLRYLNSLAPSAISLFAPSSFSTSSLPPSPFLHFLPCQGRPRWLVLGRMSVRSGRQLSCQGSRSMGILLPLTDVTLYRPESSSRVEGKGRKNTRRDRAEKSGSQGSKYQRLD